MLIMLQASYDKMNDPSFLIEDEVDDEDLTTSQQNDDDNDDDEEEGVAGYIL